MDEGYGGDVFKELCEMSMYDERNENGQTLSGYVNYIHTNQEGIVIDEYGNSIVDDPDKELVGEEGQIITKGGRSIIANERKALLEKGLFEELARKKDSFRIISLNVSAWPAERQNYLLD